MSEAVASTCEQHAHRFDCPDCLIDYSLLFDEYGIIVHDGGSSSMTIAFCPWCGTRLPESKRDRWFDELAALGFDEPLEQDIPEGFRTVAWYLFRTNSES